MIFCIIALPIFMQRTAHQSIDEKKFKLYKIKHLNNEITGVTHTKEKLQDLLKDFIVGVSILLEGQFSIGEWVSINGFKGEVLPSNLRTTKLKAYTGEIKYIANRNVEIDFISLILNSAKSNDDIELAESFILNSFMLKCFNGKTN